MDTSLEQAVRDRAKGLCEYCQFPEEQSELRHVIDHIIARQHRGQTTFDNLAVACGRCNRSKGPNIAGLDPETGQLTRLFNPRTDQWTDHFNWQSATLVGLTAIGRVTIDVLAMNHPYRIAARQVLLAAKTR
jgi:5-methylcytosine-specific restriction endonuclease McrA